MSNKVLIVGFGLAGATLAFKLEQRGIPIEIIEGDKSNSSKVAAGIYNPLVFRRLLKSWQADTFIPNLQKFFDELEIKLDAQFHFRTKILKFISSADELFFWERRANEGEINHYLPNVFAKIFKPDFTIPQTAYAEIQQSGFVRLDIMLGAAKDYFLKQNAMQLADFDFDQIDLTGEFPLYKGIDYKTIIFAEGYRVADNPYFNYLPFTLAKGEILNVRIPNAKIDYIANRDVFILPIGNDIYRVGATYVWDDINEIPTELAQEELRYKLEKMIKVPYEVIKHVAGVRPATHDRRPLLGKHPLHSQIAIFNGLGAKGVMLAPTLADTLLDNLLHNKEIPLDSNISRFENYRLGTKTKKLFT